MLKPAPGHHTDMKIFSYLLTILASTGIRIASLNPHHLTRLAVVLPAVRSGSIRLFWPQVYSLAGGGAFLFAKLPSRYGGDNPALAAVTLLVLGTVVHFISA